MKTTFSESAWQSFLDKVFTDKATQRKVQVLFGQDSSFIRLIKHCELRPDGRVSMSELYSVYTSKFAPSGGALSRKAFSRAMATLFKADRTGGRIWYSGLSLPPSEERTREIVITFDGGALFKTVQAAVSNIKKAAGCLSRPAAGADKAAVLSASKLLKQNTELLRKALVKCVKKGGLRRV